MTSMKIMLAIFLISFMLTAIINGEDVWWEESGKTYDYDLSLFQILIITGDDVDYLELMKVKNYWENWKATVTIAGTEKTLTGHVWNRTDKGWDKSEVREIKTDKLLSEIDVGNYQAIFLPGGNSPKNLLEKGDGVIKVVQAAEKKGLILSAICHGPLVLASADVIKDKKVTGHPEIQKDLEKAGGSYVEELCVVDGNVVTGNWPFFETFAVTVAEKLLSMREAPENRMQKKRIMPVS